MTSRALIGGTQVTLAAGLLLWSLSAGAAQGQDDGYRNNDTGERVGPLPAREEAKTKDEDKAKLPGASAPLQAKPTALESGGALEAATPGDKRAKEGAPERAANISANYDETLDVYRDILERQDTDTRWLDRRIETNESLVEGYKPKLQASQKGLRSVEVAFINRVLELKRQRDQGMLSDKQFRQAVEQEEARYKKRKARHSNEADFYGGESKDARVRLTKLRSERERKIREQSVRKASGPQTPDPTQALFSGIYGTLDKVSGFKTRFTMDDVAGLWRYEHLHGAKR
ncbi:hypothetical protein ACFL59_16010 [Planctomycetota bacterium]